MDIVADKWFITVDPSGRHFVRLAERGYEYLHSDEPVPLEVSLHHMIAGRSQEERANLLWDLIGPENAMFYTSGPAYYKTIRGYIDGLSPSLTDYIDAEQKSSKNGLRPSRMNITGRFLCASNRNRLIFSSIHCLN